MGPAQAEAEQRVAEVEEVALQREQELLRKFAEKAGDSAVAARPSTDAAFRWRERLQVKETHSERQEVEKFVSRVKENFRSMLDTQVGIARPQPALREAMTPPPCRTRSTRARWPTWSKSWPSRQSARCRHGSTPRGSAWSSR